MYTARYVAEQGGSCGECRRGLSRNAGMQSAIADTGSAMARLAYRRYLEVQASFTPRFQRAWSP